MVNHERIREASDYIKLKCENIPNVAIILGSGLGFLADKAENSCVIDYKDIPNFPVSTVPGHEGKLVIGNLWGQRVMMMKGRFHFYEGYEAWKVIFPIYVFKELGVKRLIITNSSGGISMDYKPGDIVLIKDVINMAFKSPLRGPNDERLGVRFPDMSKPFDKEWMRKVKEKLNKDGKRINEGVYVWSLGPSYETPAEIKAFRKLGADMVGMSTVPEVIAAAHAELKVLGFSCITNMAAGVLEEPLKHEDVIRVANMVKDKFAQIIKVALEVVK
ncbi:MAG: purine-nucleoside phosphorylase [Thermotogaceae bacterium]|nr:purine-nucleoside phosphorylase [Thermotogaceae bacterium]